MTELWAGSSILQEEPMFVYFDSQLTAAPTTFRSLQAALFRLDVGPFFIGWDNERYVSNPNLRDYVSVIHADFTERGYIAETMIAINCARMGAVTASTATRVVLSATAVVLSVLLITF